MVSTRMLTSPGNTVFDIDATTLVRCVCTVVVASAALGVGGCGDGGTDPAEIQLSIRSATSLPDAQVDVAYSETLEVTGGDGIYLWGIVSGSLSSGLSLTAGGVISGTPTAVGTMNFEVEVTSGGQTATKALQIWGSVVPEHHDELADAGRYGGCGLQPDACRYRWGRQLHMGHVSRESA